MDSISACRERQEYSYENLTCEPGAQPVKAALHSDRERSIDPDAFPLDQAERYASMSSQVDRMSDGASTRHDSYEDCVVENKAAPHVVAED